MTAYTLKGHNLINQFFLTNEVGTSKTFTLFLIIQGLLHHYNKQIHVNSLKKKALLMAYISKTNLI